MRSGLIQTYKGMNYAVWLQEDELKNIEMMDELVQILNDNVPIQLLAINDSVIPMIVMQRFADALAKNTSVKALLIQCNFRKQHASLLNEALKTNTGLQELTLDHRFNSGYINTCFITNKTLRKLSLHHCGVTNRQAAALLTALAGNTSLKYLNLSNNNLSFSSDYNSESYELEENTYVAYPNGIDIIAVLIEFIKTNTGLKEISTNYNAFKAEQWLEVAKSVKENTTLLVAEFSNFAIVGEVCQAYLQRNNTLYQRRLQTEDAYKKGATAGMLARFGIVKDIGKLIGSRLDRKTGGRVASVCVDAAKSANESMAAEGKRLLSVCLR
jgi:hypothetical protein